jgi:hypothetical protein
MYTLNKVSTLLPLVLITSYCVGTSTGSKYLQQAEYPYPDKKSEINFSPLVAENFFSRILKLW